MRLEYRQYSPSGRLASFVRCVWTLRSTAGPPEAPEPIVPDGCVELVFNLASPFRQVRAEGALVEQPRCFLVGPSTRPTVVLPAAEVDVVGLRLQPWGGGVLGTSLVEARDAVVPLDDVVPRLARACDAALAGSDDGRVPRLLDALERATRSYEPPERLAAAIAEIDRLPSHRGAARLAARLGYGLRSLERQFAAHVGLAPKTLAQVFRVHRALALARRDPGRTWAAVSVDAGYSDQSHLVRDMRRFAGAVPTEVQTGRGTLTSLFLEPFPGADQSA